MGAKEGKSEEDISNPFLWVFLAFYGVKAA
jgi:hypothetical protein